MLHRQTRPTIATPIAGFEPPAANTDIGLPQILAFVSRQRVPIVASVLLCLVAGCAYLVLMPSMYTAETALLIDTRRLAIFNEGNVYEDSTLSVSAVETQAELLRSGRIAEGTARQLGELAKDPDLLAGSSNPLTFVKRTLSGITATVFGRPQAPPAVAGAPVVPSTDPAIVRAAAAIMSGLVVTRSGLSYVINVSFTARNPYLATRVANAVAAAYLEDQMNAQFATAQRATAWLQARTEELRRQVADPKLSVQERNAVRATYDDFLQRYTQTVQQQSLPITEARVITPATIGEKSSPKALIVFAASIMLGGLVGFGLALGRDLLDRTVRTAGQVERITGVPSLGLLPKLRPSRRAQRQLTRSARKRGDSSPRRFSPGPPAYSVVLASPASSFAETLREVKVASEKALNGLAGVLGVISCLPGEGRTTVAVNFARLIAQGGSRVLFIDCDLRNPAFSQSAVPQGTPGAVQAAAGQVEVGAAIWTDSLSPLHFMPGNVDVGVAQPQDVLASAAMSNLLRALRQHYDMIIVDLPPVVPFADVQAAADLFDGFVVVAEWGRVTEEDLAHGFQKVGIAEKVIGVVLNKVDETKIARFIDAPAVPLAYR